MIQMNICVLRLVAEEKICETGFYDEEVEADFKQCNWKGIIFFTQEADA